MIYFGDRIRMMRKKKGWSQTMLGRMAGYTQPEISHFELNKVITTTEDLQRLAEALEIKSSEFYFDHNGMKEGEEGYPYRDSKYPRWTTEQQEDQDEEEK